MFRRNEIEMGKIIPTSKLSLKLSCLAACNKNIEEADRLYKYIASDMKDIPDMEPTNPTILQQADAILGWIGQHKEDFAQGVSIFQSLKGGTAPAVPTEVPPIPHIE